MCQLANISASFSTQSEWGKGQEADQKGRLILTKAEIVFGKPSFLSTKVTDSQRVFWMGSERPTSVELYKEGMLIKRHAVRIVLPERKEFLGCVRDNIVLWTSKEQATAFVEAWGSKHEDYQVTEYYRDALNREIKTRGHIVIPEMAREVLSLLRGAYKSPDLSEGDATALLEQKIKMMITEGVIAGLVEGDRYTDRDLIVRQEKIVNINVDLDFNSLIEQLGEKGISLTSLKCPQCGALCSVPETGAHFICEACGSTVYVSDVFQQFKSILE